MYVSKAFLTLQYHFHFYEIIEIKQICLFVNVKPESHQKCKLSVSPSVRRVVASVIISYQSGKLHFHAPLGALVLTTFILFS